VSGSAVSRGMRSKGRGRAGDQSDSLFFKTFPFQMWWI